MLSFFPCRPKHVCVILYLVEGREYQLVMERWCRELHGEKHGLWSQAASITGLLCDQV